MVLRALPGILPEHRTRSKPEYHQKIYHSHINFMYEFSTLLRTGLLLFLLWMICNLGDYPLLWAVPEWRWHWVGWEQTLILEQRRAMDMLHMGMMDKVVSIHRLYYLPVPGSKSTGFIFVVFMHECIRTKCFWSCYSSLLLDKHVYWRQDG